MDDGYGDIFLVVDGWGTIRRDFDELEGELQVLARRSLTFGVHLVTSATRWMDYRTGVRDVLGTRFELRLGDAMDSEIDRKLAANIPLERPGRGIMQAEYHCLGALPRVDGDNNPGLLGSGVQKLVTAVRDAWQGPPGPKLRLLPTLITKEEVRRLAPASSPTSGWRTTRPTRRPRPSWPATWPSSCATGSRAGDVTPEPLRNRSWWEGKEAFVIVDDYELVATSQGNPLDPLVPLLAQAVDIGLHVVIARRTGGAGRMYDNLVTGLRDLAQPGMLLSGDPS